MIAIDYKQHFDPEEAGLCPASGGKIWYRINGKKHFSRGKVPLLCIHGGPGLSHHYLLPLVTLSVDRPVIMYDQLDSGGSEQPDDPSNWNVARFVQEIDDLRTWLNIKDLYIIGQSWGGTIAAEYAMRQPAGLRGIILASPLINTARWIADCTEYRHQLPQNVQDTLDKHEAAGTELSEDYQEAVMVFNRRHLCRCDPWPWEIEHSFELFNYDLYRAMWGSAEFTATGILKGYDGDLRLHQIKCPVLFTCGEFDEATPAACQKFADLTPNATIKVDKGCSHTAQLEKPDDYIANVRLFLADLD